MVSATHLPSEIGPK